jgi:hypothetical protein
LQSNQIALTAVAGSVLGRRGARDSMPPADQAHIGYSKLKLVRALIVGIGAMAGNLAMAFQWPGEIDHGRFLEFIGYFGAIFCGLILYFSLRRLFDNRVIVAITPEGLMDLRVVKSPIPWRAIRTVSLWGFTRAKFIVVTLDPEVEKGLVLSPVTARTRRANRALGANGICIATYHLAISRDRLLSEIRARVAAAQAEGRGPLRSEG